MKDNYFVNQLGVIAACTGDLKNLQTYSSFNQIMAYFNVIAVPELTREELQTAFQMGVVEAILHGYNGDLKSDGLYSKSRYVNELVTGTLQVMDKVLCNNLRLNPLEHALKKYITPNLQWIGNFCGTFSLATKHLTSTASLLQLWTHEWKRFSVDPLPNGNLKSRVLWSYKKYLNEIDQGMWSLNTGWLRQLIDGIDCDAEEVWINSNLLTSTAYRLQDNVGADGDCLSIYRPVELSKMTPINSHSDDKAAHMEISFDEVLVVPNFAGTSDMRAILYPEAFSYVLRIVRLLTSVMTNIVLPCHVGSHAQQALKLASCICDMKLYQFDCKDKPEVSYQNPSHQTLYSNDFRYFLKETLLTVGGFKKVASPNFQGSVQHQSIQRRVEYSCVSSSKVLMVVTSVQLMSDDDRRLLQYIVDLDNPCLIFDNEEITGDKRRAYICDQATTKCFD